MKIDQKTQLPRQLSTCREILTEKERIEKAHGPWTAHNIQLSDKVYTLAPPYDWARHRAKWFGLVSEIHLRKPLKDMRILDIGCLEGGISLGMGESGASVTGIDVREANLAKANFSRDVLGLANVEFVEADMLQLQDYELGKFDVIVCAGTLYHVDAPDLLPFLRNLHQSCSGIVIFDTHIAVEHREEFIGEQEQVYYGRTFVETHHDTEDIEEKKKDRWGSLSNDLSFWPTERSLINLLADAGFQFVTKPMLPVVEWPWQDRGFWVAYSDVGDLLSEAYEYPMGRMSDPNRQAHHHEMLDTELQQNCKNPATRWLAEG